MLTSQINNQLKIKWGLIIAVIALLGGLIWVAVSKVRSSSAPPTIKIGLVAPFEGLYRATGYEVLFAVKLALRERNQGNGLNSYRVELVALNDFNNPDEAKRQAQALVADPDIVGVIGHLTSDASLAALPVYQQAQLALVVPWSISEEAFDADANGLVSVAATLDQTNDQLADVIEQTGIEQVQLVIDPDVANNDHPLQIASDAVTAANIILALNETGENRTLFGQVEVGNQQLVQVAGTAADGLIFASPAPSVNDLSGSATFVEAYQTMAGLPPGPRAILAYDATNVLLDSIEQAIMSEGTNWDRYPPSRPTVSAVISTTQHEGVTGDIAFDTNGRRLSAPIWFYQISEARYPGTLVVP